MEMVHGEKRPGIDSSYASSKVRAALDILLSLPKIDPTQKMDSKNLIGLASENFEGKGSSEQADTKLTEKAIVFSQWTRMLDLLEVHLKASHVTYRRLDGTMSVAARDKAVKDFNTVPEVCSFSPWHINMHDVLMYEFCFFNYYKKKLLLSGYCDDHVTQSCKSWSEHGCCLPRAYARSLVEPYH